MNFKNYMSSQILQEADKYKAAIQKVKNEAVSGDKVIAHFPDGTKKTLAPGSTAETGRGLEMKKADKMKAKIQKFFDENKNVKIEMKMYLSRKWAQVGNIEFVGTQVTEKWYM